MEDNRTVSITITLPKHYRDILRKKSAEWTLEHLDDGISAARIASNIICEYLDDWEKGLKQENQPGEGDISHE
jgi:hypothetical protein